MALYGTVQRNDAVQNTPSYGGMFARNDAPQASASQTSAPTASSQPSYGGMFARNDAAPSTPSPGMSETGYGRYGSRPRRDGGAWQGSRPGGTTGAIGGVRGGWGGAGGGWGQPSTGSIYANRQQHAPLGNTQQTYNGQPIDWSLPADKIPPPNAQQLADWERQSAIDTQRNVPANFQQQYAQMQAQSDFWANQRNPQSAPNVQFDPRVANLADRQSTPASVGGSALANATNWASQMNSASPTPSVIPGVKSGPDEWGGAPAQTPSVQFNTPWQRLGVSGYGVGNAAQGAFSEQTGQVGAPSPMPARTMPSFVGSPFVGPTYGQPMPSAPDAGVGIYGPGAVPTGMSSRYSRPPVMRTLF